jgi:hypothetical protein
MFVLCDQSLLLFRNFFMLLKCVIKLLTLTLVSSLTCTECFLQLVDQLFGLL